MSQRGRKNTQNVWGKQSYGGEISVYVYADKAIVGGM